MPPDVLTKVVGWCSVPFTQWRFNLILYFYQYKWRFGQIQRSNTILFLECHNMHHSQITVVYLPAVQEDDSDTITVYAGPVKFRTWLSPCVQVSNHLMVLDHRQIKCWLQRSVMLSFKLLGIIRVSFITLQWRHTMASQIISITIVYSIVYLGADQRKHQSSASLDLVRGIHRWSVNSPHKRLLMWKMFPFDDVIMMASETKQDLPTLRRLLLLLRPHSMPCLLYYVFIYSCIHLHLLWISDIGLLLSVCRNLAIMTATTTTVEQRQHLCANLNNTHWYHRQTMVACCKYVDVVDHVIMRPHYIKSILLFTARYDVLPSCRSHEKSELWDMLLKSW